MTLTRGVEKGQNVTELMESIGRSLDLLVMLKIREAQGERSQNEMILFLHGLGFRPVEIADLLGKTSNDVNPVISRSRKATKGSQRGSRL